MNYYGHQPPPSMSVPPPAMPAVASANTSGQKHDIFVGNLAFSTTEEQLYTAFSELGRIIKVRMVSDVDTGKPRGFAFIEFEDPQAALSAIRNMNEYEINGRKIRVNFSNSSHLETLANQLGMDLSHVTQKKDAGGGASSSSAAQKDGSSSHAPIGGQGGQAGASSSSAGGGAGGSKAVAAALRGMNKGEIYDVVAKLKEIADANPDEARKLLTQHPQLPEAILYCMSELDMIKTPVATAPGMGTSMPPPPPADPRAAAMPQPPPPTMAPPVPPPVGMPSDPRARPADPRAARDPRAAAAAPPAPAFPPPPMMPPLPMQQQQQQQPPPPAAGAVAGLDPNLVQQVMALTPAQIAQLPPDKQQSILALRQQITGGMGR